MSAAISTFEAQQTREIRLINAEIPKPFTFPARPIQGGKLERAPRKTGRWFAEPKYNGWRALVHCPSGAMWNRHGERLSIEREFAEAVGELRKLVKAGLIWADCEALGRRNKIGCGTLIVLDWIAEDAAPIYEERREFLESLLPSETMSCGGENLPEKSILLASSIADTKGQALQLYHALEAINHAVRADVFEGVVMKRGGSVYPVQLRSAREECRAWVKHRFLV